MIFPKLLILVLFFGVGAGEEKDTVCQRLPESTAKKQPGDNGYGIKIAGSPSGYEANKDYTGLYSSFKFYSLFSRYILKLKYLLIKVS